MKLTVDSEGEYKSSNGADDVAYAVWLPENAASASGIVQVVHGMNEHFALYEELARVLTENGYIVCMNEHLGHGRTGKKGGVYGYMGEKDGHTALVEDVYLLTKIITERYPNKPLFMFAHSMGSFIGRAYLSKYGAGLSGAIISGTSGGGVKFAASGALIGVLAKIFGAKGSGAFANKMNYASFNSRFKAEKNQYSWLSRDKAYRTEFKGAQETNFVFTLGGFRDMLKILNEVSKKAWAKTLPDLPIFLMSGLNDPVGDYGRGVLKVYDRLQKAGRKNTYIRLYEDGRHVMISETNKDEVFADILFFLKHKDMTEED